MFSSDPGHCTHKRADCVGIIGIDAYIPKRYVDQAELEEYYGYDKGKITIGLGQREMAVCDDREDIVSISLTVVNSILKKYNIPLDKIGRLEVGTETLIDKSKSVKSCIMKLFEDSGNTDIEGTDTVNACYGGTSAVISCINWVESSSWDGRFALAVAADIAVYDKGPARPSGGAAAVAILIGPQAPVVFSPELRSTHSENVYDFYKPILSTEYPHVDGKYSLSCYYKAFDICYQNFIKKAMSSTRGVFKSISDIDFLVFHTPFTKLVSKCVARIPLNERIYSIKSNKTQTHPHEFLSAFDSLTHEQTLSDRSLEKTLVTIDSSSPKSCKSLVSPSLSTSERVGNSYCASVWLCLASILSSPDLGDLLNKKILLFSYGSGLIASILHLSINGPLDTIRKNLNLNEVLNRRVKISPPEFEEALDSRQGTFIPSYNLKGVVSQNTFFNNTFYLDSIDDKYRRSYKLFSQD